MSIVTLKLLLLVVILGSGWIGGLIPLQKANAQSPRFLSLGNAFAAGIFLGIGLIHMLGDASEIWRTALEWRYPIALFLAGTAFLFVLWFEHVALPGRLHHAVHAPGGMVANLDAAEPPHPITLDENSPPSNKPSSLYPYALIIALSIHSLIVGVAMGAQSGLANVVLIFVAIAAHKSTAGFALGVSLARAGVPRRRALRLIGLFAVITPIGILTGLIVRQTLANHAQIVFEATFLALSAGSFVYIAAFDIIRDEFLQPGPRALKWLLAGTGYGLMGLLALWL